MLEMTVKDYVAYIKKTAEYIGSQGDYITSLDAATGDGDHWVNINSGYKALVANADALEAMNFSDLFKKAGMLMMSNVGGSGGVLYGSAYLAASKATAGLDVLDDAALGNVIESWVNEMMSRGKAQPGFKTMIDSLYPAVQAYKEALAAGEDTATILAKMKKAAIDGMNSTKEMEAGRGRATYQANKGVGNLDPGAVTMSMQLETLADYANELCVK